MRFYSCSMADGESDPEDGDGRRVLPSEYMRGLRPEIYSDTQDRAAYQLDTSQLEYHLETLTQRNETHEFEVFCRKLCEKAICPNLRPQTGPDGGGDSKADTETFPIADEISNLYFEGEPGAGRERWAFAFSAKERWKDKARHDVRGLIATGRNYDRIICVTSRFAKAKDRAALEAELGEEAGVPVTIHDRSWIVDQVIGHDRKDIAFHYLGVGTEVTDASRLGPTDYSRLQELEELERSLADPDAYCGMEPHRMVDALLAAKLSRGLEKPRVETEGRFARAIRLADQYGTLHNRVETRYERIWTAYWWFDDFAFLNDEYGAFEELASQAGHARTLGFLVNIGQLLFNSVTLGYLSAEECDLERRIDRTVDLLQEMAANDERPNNQLEAKASLLHIDMNRAVMAQDAGRLSQVWRGFAGILDRAIGLGEFDTRRVTKLIEVAQGFAGDDPDYAELIDKLSDFVAARTGEAQGALVLLRRAEKLDLTRHFEMIRLLSKAAMQLTKKEHTAELADAVSLLAVAYRSAGLLWAARATCVFGLATMIIEAEEGDRLPPRFAVVAKLWATLALDLHHLPDFLAAAPLFRGAIEGLPFKEKDREKFRRDAFELELIAASRIINLRDSELARLDDWPDILEGRGLFTVRTALLYSLGYEDVLREDGSIPRDETDEDVRRMFSMLASQPAGTDPAAGDLVLNTATMPETFTTRLLGMRVDVRTNAGDHGLLVAEAVVGSLEAFFATTVEHQIMPHVEHFTINVTEDASRTTPTFEIDLARMAGTLAWPADLPPTRFVNQADIRAFWIDIAAKMLDATCIVPDAEEMLERLCSGERVFARMTLVTTAANSYHRVMGRYLSRLEDFCDGELGHYPARRPRPDIERIDLAALVSEQSGRPVEELLAREPAADSHRRLGIRSVIDVYAWSEAKWRGAGFAKNEPGYPPFLAILFENGEAATRIFERWRERIGAYDEHDRIRLSVIRRLEGRPAPHYAIQISANALPGDMEDGDKVSFTVRSLVVTPGSDENLENFLASYRYYGAYYLIPAIWTDNMEEPHFLWQLPVLKRQLNVMDAADVTEHQIERVAVEQAKDED